MLKPHRRCTRVGMNRRGTSGRIVGREIIPRMLRMRMRRRLSETHVNIAFGASATNVGAGAPVAGATTVEKQTVGGLIGVGVEGERMLFVTAAAMECSGVRGGAAGDAQSRGGGRWVSGRGNAWWMHVMRICT